jgi:hypothetical protein
MGLNLAEAGELLIAVRAYITSQMSSCAKTCQSKQGQVARHVASNALEDAFKALPALCCFYEQEKAFAYLVKCVDETKRHLPELLTSSDCPPEHVMSVAPLCYLQRMFRWKELDRFVSEFLVRVWRKANVERLVRGDTVPDIITHVRPRADFSLEEMHGLARQMERDLRMDFGWLFAAYPATAAVSDVVGGGRKRSAPPPIEPEASECLGDLPEVRPFERDDYSQMLSFVASSLSKWNSWTFEVPN